MINPLTGEAPDNPNFFQRIGRAANALQGRFNAMPLDEQLMITGNMVNSLTGAAPPGTSTMQRFAQGMMGSMNSLQGMRSHKAQMNAFKMKREQAEATAKQNATIAQNGLKNLDVDGDGQISAEEREIGNMYRAVIANPLEGGPILKEIYNRRMGVAAPYQAKSTLGKLQSDLAQGLITQDEYLAERERLKGVGQTNVNVTLGDGSQAPTAPTANTLQGNILAAQEALRSLNNISDAHSDEFLSLWGRMKAGAGSFLDYVGVDPLGWSDFNAERGVFVQELRQFFNRYKKEITGAAAGEKEMEDLLKSMINENLPPKEFRTRYAAFVDAVESNLAANQAAASGGIQVGGGAVIDVRSEAEAEALAKAGRLKVGDRVRLPDGSTGVWE